MLDLNEMTNLEEAKRNIQDKAVILNAAIDIQALLRLLVEKEVIGKEEINSQRQEVRESSKYRNAITYIEMKFGPGTLQPEQKEFLKAMTAAGHYTCVCYTARDATETIETYLNLKWDEEMPNPPYGILKEGEWKCITEREQKRKERNAVH